jgi:hypothetical protein
METEKASTNVEIPRNWRTFDILNCNPSLASTGKIVDDLRAIGLEATCNLSSPKISARVNPYRVEQFDPEAFSRVINDIKQNNPEVEIVFF